MTRLALVLAVGAAYAQTQSREPPDPLATAIGQMHQAQNEGRRPEAYRLLAEVADLLSKADPARADFGGHAQQIAGQFRFRGFHLRAEAVFENAARRARQLGETHPSHLGILLAYGQFLAGERQTMKALAVFERLIALAEQSADGLRVRAGAYGSLARLYEYTGRFDDAEKLLKKQRDLPAGAANPFDGRPGRFFGGNFGGIVGSLPPSTNLAGFLARQGRTEEAEKVLREQIEANSPRPGAPIYEQIGPVRELAQFLRQQRRWDEALALYFLIYDRSAQSPQPEERRNAHHQLHTLAMVSDEAGRTDDAERWYRQMIELAPAAPATQPEADHLNALAAYGRWLIRHDRTEEAERVIDQCTGLAASHIGHPWMRDQSEMLRAELLERRGDPDGAREIREGLQARQLATTNRAESVLVGPLLQRGFQAVMSGRLDEAAALAEEVLALSDLAVDWDHAAVQYASLAAQIGNQGDVAAADRLYQRGYPVVRRYAETHMNGLLAFLHDYTHYLYNRKRWEDARSVIEERRDLIAATKGPDSAQMEEIYLARIDLVSLQGRRHESLSDAAELLAHQERVHGKISEPSLRALETVAEIHSSRGAPVEALEYRRRALAAGERLYPPPDLRRARILANLAHAEMEVERVDEAIAHLQQAIAIADRHGSAEAAMFRQELDHIRQRRVSPPGFSRDGSRWFETDQFSRTDGTRLGEPVRVQRSPRPG